MYSEIRIDGESLDLAEDLRIPIALVNPHLSYETIPNSTATIPNIPFSLRNQKIFEYAEMQQAGNDLYSYDCEVIYNGALVYHGKAYVKSANPLTGYQLEVGDDLGRFFGVYQDVLLTELDLGTVELPETLTPVVEVGEQPAVCFPVIFNPEFYGTNGASIDYTGYVNEYDEGFTETGPKVPMLFVNFLLNRIASLTGITLSGSFLAHETWSQLILTNWRALDAEIAVTVNRHVPPWTIGAFLLELRKIPNLELTFDAIRKELTIDFWEERLTEAPVHDWTNKAVVGHEKYPEFNRRLWLAAELDTGDNLLKDKPEELSDYMTAPGASLGGPAIGLVKVPMKLSSFLLDESGVPYAKQVGVTQAFNQLNVVTAPRLLFWHGLVEDLPIALPELDDVCLYINGENGIAATSWARTEQLRKEMFYLKKSFVLTETDLALLDFSTPIHYNGLNYLVAHVSGELPLTKECSCLLIKV
jgi:hypothetical protein